MSESRELEIRKGYSQSTDEVEAVRDLANQIGGENLTAVILFCSAKYDLERLAAELRTAFPVPALGCTTAGEISPVGYTTGGIAAVGIFSNSITLTTYLITPLSDVPDIAEEIATRVRPQLSIDSDTNAFGFLLVDGLSVMEEQVMAHLSNALDGLPLVGGSAGDDMEFNKTCVFVDGKFHSDAAVLAIVETSHPFVPFRTQHFAPTDKRMVITKATPETRIVHEINGAPAAREFARLLGLEVDELVPMIFSKHPVMLSIGGEYYVRSIQKVNEDGSLTFFCAIDEGLVLTIAKGEDLVDNLEGALEQLKDQIPEPQLILGCDCILRRLEMQEKGLTDRVAEILNENNVVGFSTYGEQFNAIHVNQTLTGIAIGK